MQSYLCSSIRSDSSIHSYFVTLSQVKYFDSGDYAMAKSTSKTGPNPLLGKAIPTPEAVTQRKHSTASKSRLVDGEHPTSPTEEKTVLLRQKEANPTHQEEEEEKQ